MSAQPITHDNPRPPTTADAVTVTPAGHRHFVDLPPRDFLPESVHEAHDAYMARLNAWQELEARTRNAEGELAEADRKDRQATMDAVRHGNDPARVGTPHRDVVLQDQRTLIYQEEAARTVAEEAKRELLQALHRERETELAELSDKIDVAAAGYATAAREMMQARRRYRWLRDRRAYWHSLDDRHGPRWPAPIGPGVEPEHTELAEIMYGMRAAVIADAKSHPGE